MQQEVRGEDIKASQGQEKSAEKVRASSTQPQKQEVSGKGERSQTGWIDLWKMGAEAYAKMLESIFSASAAGMQAVTQQAFDNYKRALELSTSLMEKLTHMHRDYLEAHREALSRLMSVVEQYSGSSSEHFLEEFFRFTRHWHEVLTATLRQGYQALENAQKEQRHLMEEFFKAFFGLYGAWADALSQVLERNTELLRKFSQS